LNHFPTTENDKQILICDKKIGEILLGFLQGVTCNSILGDQKLLSLKLKTLGQKSDFEKNL